MQTTVVVRIRTGTRNTQAIISSVPYSIFTFSWQIHDAIPGLASPCDHYLLYESGAHQVRSRLVLWAF